MINNKHTRGAPYLMAFILLMAGSQTQLLAQIAKIPPAHVGIIYPLSTNGRTAPSDTNSLSLHLISGISQQENALYIAGVSGVVIGNAYGTMVSGVSNHVGQNAQGIQVAGVINRVKRDAKGAQVAGLANTTKGTSEVQVAGLINKSADATAQLAGLINVAKKVKGVQIAGLINIAEESKYPIGVINIIEKGEMQLGLTVDESANTMVTFRSGGEILYAVLGMGYNFKVAEVRYGLEGGIGAHLLTQKRFRLNAEAVSTAMTNFEDGLYGKQSIRALAGYRLTPRIEIFAGPTFNHLLFDADLHDIRDNRYLWKWGGDHVNGFFFGGIAGLQLSL